VHRQIAAVAELHSRVEGRPVLCRRSPDHDSGS
jgi:hypothetical protein